ncbi:hypothetical protein PO883_21595 [Massilia sp. DJPM01]|uniref:hypothetical protein n=1 Tax=Massilia sp. DJPM01 TaxID=3024404 RepID=UPI00259EDE3F|nr:hypothetical protein [Massilia sp. DJPM01]MDM5179790.1 hypothetical protein [Massilia sp. DJPM01]
MRLLDYLHWLPGLSSGGKAELRDCLMAEVIDMLAAKLRNFLWIAGKWKRLARSLAVSCQVIKELNVCACQCQSRPGVWVCAVEHGREKLTPADDAKDRDQLGASVCGLQRRILGLVSGFENLVECVDLPPQGLPIQLFNRFCDSSCPETDTDLNLYSCFQNAQNLN